MGIAARGAFSRLKSVVFDIDRFKSHRELCSASVV